MIKYNYKCFDCGRTYGDKKVERQFIYLCPECGSADKNQPLHGVLTVEYDYDEIRSKFSRNDLLKSEPGKFWLYPFLWNINISELDEKLLNRLALPKNLIFKFNLNNQDVLVMDETRNPTLSYKDRASSVVALKAMELGITEIAAASTGNAGSSLAGICARLGLTSRIFVPKNIPEAKRIQIEAYGAKLTVVEGDYDKAFDVCLEESLRNNWYNRNTAYNPLTIEGKKSAAFDIFIETNGDLPEYIFVPVGDGVIISGIYKGFRELLTLGWIEKIPKLIAVQSERSDALVRYLQSGKFEYKPADTIADSISAGAPRNLFMAAHAVKESEGFSIAVSDNKILSAQKKFIKQTGILCEPSSAAVYAAFKKSREENRLPEKAAVLLLITGNGLKDIGSLANNL